MKLDVNRSLLVKFHQILKFQEFLIEFKLNSTHRSFSEFYFKIHSYYGQISTMKDVSYLKTFTTILFQIVQAWEGLVWIESSLVEIWNFLINLNPPRPTCQPLPRSNPVHWPTRQCLTTLPSKPRKPAAHASGPSLSLAMPGSRLSALSLWSPLLRVTLVGHPSCCRCHCHHARVPSSVDPPLRRAPCSQPPYHFSLSRAGPPSFFLSSSIQKPSSLLSWFFSPRDH
jgi:hypothetical protein